MNGMRLADQWVCDSGASHHMTGNKQYFAKYKKCSAPINLSLADTGSTLAYAFGRVKVEMRVQGK
jgi:hypothetical protein